MTSPVRQPRRELAPVLRRAYFDCRYGQLHVHQAIPPGGGFDEHMALLCLPAPDAAASIFRPLLTLLGARRSVYALDPPGAGQSDAAPSSGGAGALADAAADLLRDLRIRQVHVLADAAAAPAVAALMAQAPQRVSRVALCAGAVRGFEPQGARLCMLSATLAELAAGAAPAVARLLEFIDAPENLA